MPRPRINFQVPACILIVRNSTDAGFFRRLLPYPRVYLRRGAARFKDYDSTPIGFGIAVFCIVVDAARCGGLYTRFFDAFSAQVRLELAAQSFESPPAHHLRSSLACLLERSQAALCCRARRASLLTARW